MALNSSVQLIIGDEEFLAERVRLDLTAEVRNNAADGEQVHQTTLRAGDITGPELIEATSPSLFGDERIVVVTNAETAGKEPLNLLLDACVNPAPSVTIIIVYAGGGRNQAIMKKIEKLAQTHRVAKLKPSERANWLTQEFRRHNVRVGPEIIHSLLEGVGSDLRELVSAVSQLVADTNGNVTEAAVREYYQGVAEVSGFDIADAAVAGHTSQAVASVRRALQLGEPPVKLAYALASKVGTVARLYSEHGGNAQKLAGQLGMPPWLVDKSLKVARRWRGENVSQAVMIIAELDAEVKGQGGDAEYALESAVRKISELAR